MMLETETAGRQPLIRTLRVGTGGASGVCSFLAAERAGRSGGILRTTLGLGRVRDQPKEGDCHRDDGDSCNHDQSSPA